MSGEDYTRESLERREADAEARVHWNAEHERAWYEPGPMPGIPDVWYSRPETPAATLHYPTNLQNSWALLYGMVCECPPPSSPQPF